MKFYSTQKYGPNKQTADNGQFMSFIIDGIGYLRIGKYATKWSMAKLTMLAQKPRKPAFGIPLNP
eukprot:11104370-Ditylum_brightwellii.AAC.1